MEKDILEILEFDKIREKLAELFLRHRADLSFFIE